MLCRLNVLLVIDCVDWSDEESWTKTCRKLCGSLLYADSTLNITGQFAKSNGLPLHLDGARLLHASTFLGCSADELTRDVDSVMMCISKGLGAPVGSLLAGSKEFCNQ